MSTIQTRTHGHCAAQDCPHTMREAIRHDLPWHKISGHVWAAERRTFVVWSWAEACPEHAPAVVAAVRDDVHTWHDRWEVIDDTYHYGQGTPHQPRTAHEGIGAPTEDDGRLF